MESLQINAAQKIIVRTYGRAARFKIEFYGIVGQKSKTLFYVQKLKMKPLIGTAGLYCYYVPTNTFEDDLKIVKKVKEGYRFEEFLLPDKNCFDGCGGIVYFQFDEKQYEWDGYPVKFNPYNLISNNSFRLDIVSETDAKYNEIILPIVRRKKLEKLNSLKT